MFSTLFWALYAVDVLNNIRDIAQTLLGIACIVSGVGVFLCSMIGGNDLSAIKTNISVFFSGWRTVLLGFVIGLYVLSWGIPSKQTMYMMLGTKATEQVVNSETGQLVQKAITQKLQEYVDTFSKEHK